MGRLFSTIDDKFGCTQRTRSRLVKIVGVLQPARYITIYYIEFVNIKSCAAIDIQCMLSFIANDFIGDAFKLLTMSILQLQILSPISHTPRPRHAHATPSPRFTRLLYGAVLSGALHVLQSQGQMYFRVQSRLYVLVGDPLARTTPAAHDEYECRIFAS